MGSMQVAAVEAEYDRRSPEWETRYAGDRYADHLVRERKAMVLDIAGRRCPVGGRVVDVGCGAGQLLADLARRGWQPVGCDISTRQAAATNRRLDGRAV